MPETTTTKNIPFLPVPEISAKEAAQLAINYFKEMRSLTKSEPSSFTIDEVEFDEKSRNWKITLGYDTPYSMLGHVRERQHQVITIDSINRKVISMKLR